jgi:hypothetical protein
MKELIRDILKEETSGPIEIARKYLSTLNLEPWEDNRYNMQYLIEPKSRRIIFLSIPNDFECSILSHFYNMLKVFFKDDLQEMADFIYGYLKENGLDLPFNENDFWLSESEDTGLASEEDGDTPMKKDKLSEGRKPNPENKFVKSWLSRFNNLKKYKSENGRYIYLAGKSGQIVVKLDTQINETYVNSELIYKPIESIVGLTSARRKIIGWLLDTYHLPGMGYVLFRSQESLGNISDDAIPYEQETINESEEKSKLERFFIKRWDEQKKRGVPPNIMDLKLMGLESVRNEILQYFVKYMGLDGVYRRSQAFSNYLLANTFTEKQIKLMTEHFEQGRITVKFNNVEFSENERYGGIDLDIEFVVLDGSFYNSEIGENMNFSSGDIPFDDMMEYFGFKEVIEEVIEGFVADVLESFGYDINKDFSDIKIKW